MKNILRVNWGQGPQWLNFAHLSSFAFQRAFVIVISISFSLALKAQDTVLTDLKDFPVKLVVEPGAPGVTAQQLVVSLGDSLQPLQQALEIRMEVDLGLAAGVPDSVADAPMNTWFAPVGDTSYKCTSQVRGQRLQVVLKRTDGAPVSGFGPVVALEVFGLDKPLEEDPLRCGGGIIMVDNIFKQASVWEEAVEVQVFPNPFVEELRVRGNNLKTIELHDLSGTMVHQASISLSHNGLVRIPCADLPGGMYILRMRMGNGEVVVKRVVKR